VLLRIHPEIAAALDRGVRVEVAWGDLHPAELDEGLKHFKSWQHSLKTTHGRRPFIGSRASGSNVRVIISDPDGHFDAILGTYDWLSLGREPSHLAVSVRLDHPGALSDISLRIADILDSDAEKAGFSGMATTLRNIATDCERGMAVRKVQA